MLWKLKCFFWNIARQSLQIIVSAFSKLSDVHNSKQKNKTGDVNFVFILILGKPQIVGPKNVVGVLDIFWWIHGSVIKVENISMGGP